MSHTPWTQEQAEKWAEKWWVDFPGDSRVDPMDGETFRGWTETHKQAFIAGLQKAAEMIEERDEEFYVREIEKWQFAWMNVTGTTEEDSKNYRERSCGIDANMRYDLARRLV